MCFEYAGNDTFVLCGLRGAKIFGTGGCSGEAKFAVGSLGAKALGELELLARLSGDGECSERFGGGEVGASFELGGDMTQNPALESSGFGDQAGNVEGNAFCGCRGTSTAANRTTAENHAGRKASGFGLPPGFLITGQRGKLREVFAKLRVPGFELRQEFVANAIAGKGEMAVGGVLAPRLIAGVKQSFDLLARGLKERAQDRTFGEVQDWVDAGKPFCPCAAKKFGEHGLGLVVQSMCGGNRIEGNLAKQLTKPGIA
jgi:hypothetical protein